MIALLVLGILVLLASGRINLENDSIETNGGARVTNDIAFISFDPIDVKSLIYVVRNQQVMLNSDLAMLYDVVTKVFKQAVRRNENRFPGRFRFRLTSKEEEDAILVIRNTDF